MAVELRFGNWDTTIATLLVGNGPELRARRRHRNGYSWADIGMSDKMVEERIIVEEMYHKTVPNHMNM